MGPSMCTPWLVVYSLGSREGLVGCYCCSSYRIANLFTSFSPFSNPSIGDAFLSPMIGCKHPPLYLSGSGKDSQETAISGSCQHALLGIHNSVWVWCLYMGWIPMWGCLWMVYASISALYFISIFAPVSILFSFKEGLKHPHFGLPPS